MLRSLEKKFFTIVTPLLEEEELYFGDFKGPPKEEEGTHKSLHFA
jgi:hypothetical protein